jgi:MFS superfamily sulfate permease-like transporter
MSYAVHGRQHTPLFASGDGKRIEEVTMTEQVHVEEITPPPQQSDDGGTIAGVRGVLRHARLNRHEIAGSLGDMGTFLPLLVGMTVQNGLDFAAALFFAGLFNIVTGLTFSIPMAVQPMKAIAAVALTEGLTVPQILAAGATVSLVILILGITGLIDWLNRVVPKSVVRGLQLALGLSLLTKGMQMVVGTSLWFAPDSYLTGLASAILVLLLFFSRKVPAALILFVVGLAIAIWTHPTVVAGLGIGVTLPKWTPPGWADFVSAFPKAALPQIPLTTLNSVIAVCALSTDLFPDRAASPRKVAVSVGLMNLVAAWFGGMPMCHGAGGLAGQYRFGARTNGSILFLGAVKMTLAVFLGGSLLSLCKAFPASVLGIMLAFSGMELALVCRDQTRRTDAFSMLLTTAVCMGLNNIALGFILGVAMAWCARLGLFRLEHPENGP